VLDAPHRASKGDGLDATGKRDIDIVFEHPVETTFPVSCPVIKRGRTVVFCAGTTGYSITFDARYVWMRQKRVPRGNTSLMYGSMRVSKARTSRI
jgi:NADPH:quinone reductase-like Zn-dependent oxidoreductase